MPDVHYAGLFEARRRRSLTGKLNGAKLVRGAWKDILKDFGFSDNSDGVK